MSMEKERTVGGDVALQLPETNPTPPPSSAATTLLSSGPAFLRVVCLVSSVVALSLMVTSEEEANVSVYGIQFPVSSKWTFSDSFEYLVAVSAAVMAHTMLQLLISVCGLQRQSPLVSSRNYKWIVFAGDQVFAYAMISAASAAAGVANLNRTGIRHTVLPNFCKPLHAFCSRVAASIVFSFFSAFLLATSSILDVISLSSH